MHKVIIGVGFSFTMEYHLVTHNRRHEKASNVTVGDLGRPWMTLNVNKQDLD